MSKTTLNKVILIGFIGKDPEVKQTANGLKIATFSVATNESAKDQGEVTLWHRVSAFGKLADIIESYFIKGAKVYVEGRLQQNIWIDKNGKEHNQLNVIANQAMVLSSGSQGQTTPIAKPPVDDFYDDQIPF